MNPYPDFMTIDEVANYLHVERDTIYRSRANGHFPPAARILGRLRWRREDIDSYIENQLAQDAHALRGRRINRVNSAKKDNFHA